MVDISLSAAFFAGILSFLSPCILPMVPFYLSYLGGMGAAEMARGGAVTRHIRARAVIGALFFSAGVLSVFVGLGASASLLGQVLRDWFDVLSYVAAALIIAMGLHFLGVIRIGILNRVLRAEPGDTGNLGLGGAYVIGLAFAFGWTPCIGPILAAILFLAGMTDTAGQGMALLVSYGVGMTLPFVLAAGAIGPFLRFMVRFRPHLGKVERIMGAALVIFGLLIATNSLIWIGDWMLRVMPFFQRLG
jgi:cytochrome c-type biogenesis protein